MHLLHGAQHIGRAQIDSQPDSFGKSEIGPRPLKHMGEREEIQEDIILTQRQDPFMDTEAFVIHSVCQDYSLAHSGRAAGIENIGNVVKRGGSQTVLQFGVPGIRLTVTHEFIEENGKMVLLVFYNTTVENDDFLQRGTKRHHTECRIILLLLAYKNIAYGSIVYHIGNLRSAACGIKGYGDGTNAITSEIHEKAFGLVLREDGHILLHLHSQGE